MKEYNQKILRKIQIEGEIKKKLNWWIKIQINKNKRIKLRMKDKNTKRKSNN